MMKRDSFLLDSSHVESWWTMCLDRILIAREFLETSLGMDEQRALEDRLLW